MIDEFPFQDAMLLSPNKNSVNHLGSTAFVTDANATVTQGFLYAPFGEITTEYAPLWQNGTLPKYSFNAKELDEETGMYYYEARYYAPPTFTSRDPHFEKYFWMTPYAYCANNPMKYVDPSGCRVEAYNRQSKQQMKRYFREQFGSSNMFRFNINNELKINQRQFNKAMNRANSDQKILLQGMSDVIKSKQRVRVQINAKSDYFRFCPYNDESGNKYYPINTNDGATIKTSFGYIGVAINHEGANSTELQTNATRRIGKDDVVPAETGKNASAVFMHELLDEALNFYIKKNTNESSTQVEKVYYQNAALRNKSLPERNGVDHQ